MNLNSSRRGGGEKCGRCQGKHASDYAADDCVIDEAGELGVVVQNDCETSAQLGANDA